VRNSSVEVMLVVLTEGWPAVFVVVVLEADFVVLGFALVIEALDDVVVLVVDVVAGEPECCRSLACSVMRVGPNWASFFRSCGTIFVRTRSLTGRFEFSSE